MLEEVVLPKTSRLYDWLNPRVVEDLVTSHSLQNDRSNMLWLLLILGVWLEQNRDVAFVAAA